MRRSGSGLCISGGTGKGGGDGRQQQSQQPQPQPPQEEGFLRGLGLGLEGKGADEFGQYNYDDGDEEIEETRGYACGGFLIDFRPWWCGCCLKVRNCLVSCGAHMSCYCVMVLCHLWNLLPDGGGLFSAHSSMGSSLNGGPVKRRSINGKAYEMVRVAD